MAADLPTSPTTRRDRWQAGSTIHDWLNAEVQRLRQFENRWRHRTVREALAWEREHFEAGGSMQNA